MNGLLYFRSCLLFSAVAHGVAIGAFSDMKMTPARLLNVPGSVAIDVSLVPGDSLSGGTGAGLGIGGANSKDSYLAALSLLKLEALSDCLVRRAKEGGHDVPQAALSENKKKSRSLRAEAPVLVPPKSSAPISFEKHLWPEAQEQCGASAAGVSAEGLGVGSGFGNGNSFGGAGEGDGDGLHVLQAPKPPYPLLARKAGFEGRVVLKIVVGKDGRVKNAEIIQSSGREDCDESARRTIIESWLFEPARRNGYPVEWGQKVAVSYRLQ